MGRYNKCFSLVEGQSFLNERGNSIVELTVLINLILWICASAGFLNGAATFFKKKQALYTQMVTIALGCAALGRLYNIAVLVCDGSIPRTFNTGVLATIGCFMFIFSANYGQMDSLCDMEEPKNRKIRYLAFAAPIILLGSAVFIWIFSSDSLIMRLTSVVQIFFIMLASYYNCKHLMIHDVEFGIIGSIRGYNLCMLLLELLYTLEIVLNTLGMDTPLSIVYLLMCIAFLAIIPVLKKGGQKWKV